MTQAQGASDTWPGPRWILLGLLLLVVFSYAPALDAGFVWDDDANVTENHALRSARGLANLWFRPGTTTQYYPLVYTTMWVEYQLFGLEPRVYHVINLLLHALSTLVLWRLLVLLRLPAAGFAAALFAVHPVQVETVAWVTERKNLLSSLFYLSSAYVYFRYARPLDPREPDGATNTRRGHAAAFALYCAALLSKITTVTLGPALLVVTWWKRGRLERRDWRAVLPMLAVGLPLGLLTRGMESGLGVTLGFEWDPTLLGRVLQATRALCFYVGKLVWPVDLAFVYPRWDIDPAAASAYWPLVVSVVTLGALYRLRERIGRGPLAAALFFAGTLAPVLGLLEVYYFRFSYVADHWLYLACIGPFALAAGALGERARHADGALRAVQVGAAVLLVAALSIASHAKTRTFESSLTLWQDTVAHNPDSYLVRYNLGLELQQRGRTSDALAQYAEALRLRPDSVPVRVNRGLIEAQRGRFDEAIAEYRAGLAHEPENPRLLWNLGLAYVAQDRVEPGLELLARSLAQRDPRPGERSRRIVGHTRYAELLATQGRGAEAIAQYRHALALAPERTDVRMRLAQLLADLGRPAEAQRELDAVRAVQPDAPGARALQRRLGRGA